MIINDLFQVLWSDYVAITPVAGRVCKLLESRGETIVNDHIALRTFGHPRVDIEVLDRVFVDAGYEPIDTYEFKEKKLVAYHYEHPGVGLPKVFISALLLDECSQKLRDIVSRLLDDLPVGAEASWLFAASGRSWALERATYEALLEESQYAAWLAAFGFRANHFTVLVNALKSVDSLSALNEVLVEEGFTLNDAGGQIKGSPALGLEQSSTMADAVSVDFSDGSFAVPSCYYEFAYRHPQKSGELFQGFVADSAQHLFESTDS